jgi:hypothetical protein
MAFFMHCYLWVLHMTENSMSKTAHVVRRGAVYYYRLRVPADLLEHYGKNRSPSA